MFKQLDFQTSRGLPPTHRRISSCSRTDRSSSPAAGEQAPRSKPSGGPVPVFQQRSLQRTCAFCKSCPRTMEKVHFDIWLNHVSPLSYHYFRVGFDFSTFLGGAAAMQYLVDFWWLLVMSDSLQSQGLKMFEALWFFSCQHLARLNRFVNWLVICG